LSSITRSVASPARTTETSCPISREPLAAMCSGTEARVAHPLGDYVEQPHFVLPYSDPFRPIGANLSTTSMMPSSEVWCTGRRSIHPSAWKGYPPKFALRDDQVRAVSSTLVRSFDLHPSSVARNFHRCDHDYPWWGGHNLRNECLRHPPCSSHRPLLVGSQFPWLLAPVLRFAPSRSAKSVRRIAPSFGYYSVCKHLFAVGEHPQLCISIHRCYKL
jgi:hypothetical protein